MSRSRRPVRPGRPRSNYSETTYPRQPQRSRYVAEPSGSARHYHSAADPVAPVSQLVDLGRTAETLALPAGSVAWHPSGDFLAVGHYDTATVTIYEWTTGVGLGEATGTFDRLARGWYGPIAWNPSGTRIAAGKMGGVGNAISHATFNAADGTVGAPATTSVDGTSNAIAWIDDDRFLYNVSATSLRAYNAAFGMVLSVSGTTSVVHIAQNPVYTLVTHHGTGAATNVFKIMGSTVITNGWTNPYVPSPYSDVSGVAWHPGGEWIALGRGKTSTTVVLLKMTIEVPSTVAETVEVDLVEQFDTSVHSVAWDPDGDRLVVAGHTTSGDILASYTFDPATGAIEFEEFAASALSGALFDAITSNYLLAVSPSGDVALCTGGTNLHVVPGQA